MQREKDADSAACRRHGQPPQHEWSYDADHGWKCARCGVRRYCACATCSASACVEPTDQQKIDAAKDGELVLVKDPSKVHFKGPAERLKERGCRTAPDGSRIATRRHFVEFNRLNRNSGSDYLRVKLPATMISAIEEYDPASGPIDGKGTTVACYVHCAGCVYTVPLPIDQVEAMIEVALQTQ